MIVNMLMSCIHRKQRYFESNFQKNDFFGFPEPISMCVSELFMLRRPVRRSSYTDRNRRLMTLPPDSRPAINPNCKAVLLERRRAHLPRPQDGRMRLCNIAIVFSYLQMGERTKKAPRSGAAAIPCIHHSPLRIFCNFNHSF
jgi:hypothetical protein